MTDIIIRKIDRPLDAELAAPPCKYFTHRAFILGSLAEGETKVLGTSEAEDNVSCVRAIRALGAQVARIPGGYKLWGGPYRPPDDVINVGNSGTTIQFLLGLASTAPGTTVFTGDESTRRRPLGPLVEALNKWGVPCWSTRGNGMAPLVVEQHSGLKPVVESSGWISQWISALLLIAPFAEQETTILITTPADAPTYVRLTIDMMAQCGITVHASDDHRSYVIPAPQKFSPTDFRVPGDFALAAYGLVAAALNGGRVKCTNLDITSIQAEKGILTFLQQMGADLIVDQDARSVELRGGARLRAIEWDGNDTPDSVPLMTLVSALARGKSVIYNISQLKAKESDRLAAMLQLNKMGAKVSVFDDRLEIDGVETLHGANLDSLLDHRLAMTWTIAGAVAEGETLARGADMAAVSYPDFLEDMRRLGLDYEEGR
jgi:3-phosphoshikimate 1-carboxyvinyltransferase